jgi:hypothetical protein
MAKKSTKGGVRGRQASPVTTPLGQFRCLKDAAKAHGLSRTAGWNRVKWGEWKRGDGSLTKQDLIKHAFASAVDYVATEGGTAEDVANMGVCLAEVLELHLASKGVVVK